MEYIKLTRQYEQYRNQTYIEALGIAEEEIDKNRQDTRKKMRQILALLTDEEIAYSNTLDARKAEIKEKLKQEDNEELKTELQELNCKWKALFFTRWKRR
jgi:hypothetical protein